jgi:hypothetical protein
MRPPTGARPAARDTSNSAPLQLPATTSEARALIRRTNTHRRRRAATKPGRARPGESCYRWRTWRQGCTSGDAAARRCGVPLVASSRRSSFFRAAARRRSPAPSAGRPPSAGRCRSPPARSGAPASRVMRRASSRGSTSISPRELRREPGAQADSSARDALGGSRRRKGRTLKMRANGHRRGSRTHTVEPLEDPVPRELPDESPEREEPAEPPREPGEGTGVRRRPHGSAGLRRADRRLARLVRRRSRGRPSALLDRLPHALAAAAGARRELPQPASTG